MGERLERRGNGNFVGRSEAGKFESAKAPDGPPQIIERSSAGTSGPRPEQEKAGGAVVLNQHEPAAVRQALEERNE